MVTFARAKAKLLFSKIRFATISKTQIKKSDSTKNEEKSIMKEINSNYFLEALKSGGGWLS